MVTCHNEKTWKDVGAVPREYFELRNSRCVVEQGWREGLTSMYGMEWDPFDTPAATYLAWREGFGGDCKAGCRLSPTTLPYLLQHRDFRPMCTKIRLPKLPHVWEMTRLVSSATLSATSHRRALHELVASVFEFGLDGGIRHVLVASTPAIIDRIFREVGVEVEELGPPVSLRTGPCVAGRFEITAAGLREVRRRTGLAEPVLLTKPPRGPEELKRLIRRR
ncbi:MAG TPA: acyl-homoserine-lactone synthase [Bryobacteraceae bacterium]|nr:acyl-homoserine-lactone synthase [Bryobacteraceae bacterium]